MKIIVMGCICLSNNHYRNNYMWKEEFRDFLKNIFSEYNIDYRIFCEKYNCCQSTVRYWLIGRNLPQKEIFIDLKSFIADNINKELYKGIQIHSIVKNIFERNQQPRAYTILNNLFIDERSFVVESLSTLYNFAKNNFSILQVSIDEVRPTGKIQAVIFDFDGTLTAGKTNKTTWEQLWIKLNYDIRMCQELHMQYDRDEITHSEWCKLTEKKFCERNLNKKDLEKIARDIKLINGIEETFKELESRNIKMYIVSGSILYIIKCALGNLSKYIDEMKANIFKFNDQGFLTEIVGTKYDFEGKADFICNIATELHISTQDILFVGNSINDRFAYTSGAKTLCINPQLTDTTNRGVWNDCIPTCENLIEILKYI